MVAATDLVMLDLKAMDAQLHRRVTGLDNANILAMARKLSDMGKPMWIRHVLVPGLTDGEDDLPTDGGVYPNASNRGARGRFCRIIRWGFPNGKDSASITRLKACPRPTKEQVAKAEAILKGK